MKRLSRILFAAWSIAGMAQAEVTRHPGSNEALPDQKYIHVISETDSPVQQTWIKALPRGEILLPGALEALELTIEFVKQPRQ